MPLNVGLETVPSGAPLTLRVASVPVNVGVDERAALAPVMTVVLLPFVGRVPALKDPAVQLSVSVSFVTLVESVGNVQDGSVPTAVIEFTVVVCGVTVILGFETVPAGV